MKLPSYASALEVTVAGKPVEVRPADYPRCKNCPPLWHPFIELPDGAKQTDVAAAFRGVCGPPAPVTLTWESTIEAKIAAEPPEPSVHVVVDNRGGKQASTVLIGSARVTAKADAVSATSVYGWTCAAAIVRDGEPLGTFEPEKNKIYSPGVLITRRKDHCYRITPQAYTLTAYERPQVPPPWSVQGASVHPIPYIHHLFEPAPATKTISQVVYVLDDC